MASVYAGLVPPRRRHHVSGMPTPGMGSAGAPPVPTFGPPQPNPLFSKPGTMQASQPQPFTPIPLGTKSFQPPTAPSNINPTSFQGPVQVSYPPIDPGAVGVASTSYIPPTTTATTAPAGAMGPTTVVAPIAVPVPSTPAPTTTPTSSLKTLLTNPFFYIGGAMLAVIGWIIHSYFATPES
jgi:hypothetical protein